MLATAPTETARNRKRSHETGGYTKDNRVQKPVHHKEQLQNTQHMTHVYSYGRGYIPYMYTCNIRTNNNTNISTNNTKYYVKGRQRK